MNISSNQVTPCELCGQPSSGFGSITRDNGVFCSHECKSRVVNDNPCEWCGKYASGFGSTTFDNGVEHLEFCSNECMEDWQERDFDRRAERAHERSMQ